jgi:hypothetical protein
MTAYLRAGERSAARLDVFNGANGVFARFNLLDGTVLTAATAFGAGWVAGTASIVQSLARRVRLHAARSRAMRPPPSRRRSASTTRPTRTTATRERALRPRRSSWSSSTTRRATCPRPRRRSRATWIAASLALGSWFNAAGGALLAAFYRDSYVAATQNIASLSDNTANERFDLFGNDGF